MGLSVFIGWVCFIELLICSILAIWWGEVLGVEARPIFLSCLGWPGLLWWLQMLKSVLCRSPWVQSAGLGRSLEENDNPLNDLLEDSWTKRHGGLICEIQSRAATGCFRCSWAHLYLGVIAADSITASAQEAHSLLEINSSAILDLFGSISFCCVLGFIRSFKGCACMPASLCFTGTPLDASTSSCIIYGV